MGENSSMRGQTELMRRQLVQLTSGALRGAAARRQTRNDVTDGSSVKFQVC